MVSMQTSLQFCRTWEQVRGPYRYRGVGKDNLLSDLCRAALSRETCGTIWDARDRIWVHSVQCNNLLSWIPPWVWYSDFYYIHKPNRVVIWEKYPFRKIPLAWCLEYAGCEDSWDFELGLPAYWKEGRNIWDLMFYKWRELVPVLESLDILASYCL